jgi:hypothetical protein
VVTRFCHLEGGVFWQFIFINACKLGIPKIGGVKNVNMKLILPAGKNGVFAFKMLRHAEFISAPHIQVSKRQVYD